MSKASIHIKPCNIAQSEAHNRRDKEYLKSLNPDMIYIDTFLTPFNKSYVTPEQEFTSLQEYYEELKAMVKEKTEALESEIKGLDFDEEELSVPEIETDSIVKKAKEAIRKELSIPVPVVGREKWREEREEAVKAIMTHMEDNLIAAKGSQKRKILSYGKALYKQTKREIYKTSEENKQLKGVNQRLTKENDSLKGKLASVDENAVRKLRTELVAANQRAENADLATAQEKEKTNREWRRAEQERNRADNAEAQVSEILSVPEIKQFWEMILRQKAFLEDMNRRIAKAVKALYDFALNRDLIFSKEAEASIGNGIIAEAILERLGPYG